MADNDQVSNLNQQNKQANQLNQSVDAASQHLGQYPLPCPSCGYCPTCGQRRPNYNFQYWPQYPSPTWVSAGPNTTTFGMAEGGTFNG